MPYPFPSGKLPRSIWYNPSYTSLNLIDKTTWRDNRTGRREKGGVGKVNCYLLAVANFFPRLKNSSMLDRGHYDK